MVCPSLLELGEIKRASLIPATFVIPSSPTYWTNRNQVEFYRIFWCMHCSYYYAPACVWKSDLPTNSFQYTLWNSIILTWNSAKKDWKWRMLNCWNSLVGHWCIQHTFSLKYLGGECTIHLYSFIFDQNCLWFRFTWYCLYRRTLVYMYPVIVGGTRPFAVYLPSTTTSTVLPRTSYCLMGCS